MTNRLSGLMSEILNQSPVFLIGRHRVTPTDHKDYAVIISGLALWCSLLLDQCDSLSETVDMARTCKGRIQKIQLLQGPDGAVDISIGLSYLDRCSDILLEEMSSDAGFKVRQSVKRILREEAAGQPWFQVCLRQVLTLVRTRGGEGDDTTLAREILQSTMFLKKITVNRPDLQEDLFQSYVQFERDLELRSSLDLDVPWVASVVHEMNLFMKAHSSQFSVDQITPRHGPGAVSDKSVKCKYEKYLHMRTDARIQYLLRTRSLGEQRDYNPLVKEEVSSRTSRFIGVPKTWKKLRGIAAEPIELQFFQQAVRRALDVMLKHDKTWRSMIDLHDQTVSQRMALEGSISGRYATIDLSAASDSVTLELVRRVFKGTPILPWLLGTRSTHAEVDQQSVRLLKFASMGSSCCFPVESIVFALAARVASDRVPGRIGGSHRPVRVFGDDIIVCKEVVPYLLKILAALGFSVNTEKSYWTGGFREACGVMALAGSDIRPLRFSDLDLYSGSSCMDGPMVTQAISVLNGLFERGYHDTRRDVLSLLLQGKCNIGSQSVSLAAAIVFTESGVAGTCASAAPTNFHLRTRWNGDNHGRGGLYRLEYERILWRLRPLPYFTIPEESDEYSTCKYVEWLIRHQADECEEDEELEDDPLRIMPDLGDGLMERVPLGMTMVPTRKWVGFGWGVTSLTIPIVPANS